jgi:putative oxidoreductase
MTDSIQPGRMPPGVVTLGLAATWSAALYDGFVQHQLADFAAWSASGWALLALCSALWLTPRQFVPGYLVSLLAFLVAWRVAAMNDAWLMVSVASVTGVLLLLQFIDCVVVDWRRLRGQPQAWLGTLAWQATLVRLCFGLNEIGHSAEKIFAGMGSYHTLVHGFQGFGLGAYAGIFVIMGGLIELASAISVGLGLFARLGAVISLVYFLVATVGFGGEWMRGYAWATPGGGGWEYVMMLLVVFTGVLMTGAGRFSIDAWLLQQGWLPGWARGLCINAYGQQALQRQTS